MKVSMARMITNLTARGRALGSRFAWWSRWFPPPSTVDADRFQGEAEPYPDHWKEFPRSWPAGRVVDPQALSAAVARLPEPWRRVVMLRDVEGRPSEEVSAVTGLTTDQQRDVLNRARELLREDVGRRLTRDRDGS